MTGNLTGKWETQDGSLQLDLRADGPGGTLTGTCQDLSLRIAELRGWSPGADGGNRAFCTAIRRRALSTLTGVLFLDAPDGVPVVRLLSSGPGKAFTLRRSIVAEPRRAPGMSLPRAGHALKSERILLTNCDPRSSLRMLDLVTDAQGVCVGIASTPAEARSVMNGFIDPFPQGGRQQLAISGLRFEASGSISLAGVLDRGAATADFSVGLACAVAYADRSAALGWQRESFRITRG